MKSLWFVLAVVLLATGCSPIMVPVGDSQPSSYPSTYPPHSSPSSSPKSAPQPAVTPSEPTPQGDVIVPTKPHQQQVSNSAVEKLLADAWRYNRTGEYDRSNTVAERAMRINHTEPEIYLVMASNYFASAQLHLAEQLASQGLPLAGSNYSVKKSLQQLLLDIRSRY